MKKTTIIWILLAEFVLVAALGFALGYFGDIFKRSDEKPPYWYADEESNIQAHSEQAVDLGEYIYDSEWKFFEENGAIPDEETAEKIGEDVLYGFWGEYAQQFKPYHAVYHSNYDAWLVYGTLYSPWGTDVALEGLPHLILQKTDGKVLAMWLG